MNAGFDVYYYQTRDARIPYQEWLESIKDPIAFAAVQMRTDRLERGLFGD